MDQLHEELKEPLEEPEDQNQDPDQVLEVDAEEPGEVNDAGEANEADTLITDEDRASKERQREKNLINERHRADLDKDVDTAVIVCSQGAVKQNHAAGKTP